MKYRIIRDDNHPHADFHTYLLGQVETDFKGRIVSFKTILTAHSFEALIQEVDEIADSFNDGVWSLKHMQDEININLKKKENRNEIT